jgi:hypothetical protein
MTHDIEPAGVVIVAIGSAAEHPVASTAVRITGVGVARTRSAT